MGVFLVLVSRGSYETEEGVECVRRDVSSVDGMVKSPGGSG